MDRKNLTPIGLGLLLALNGVFLGALAFRSPPPAAHGQTAGGPGEFILGTEKLPDQTPVCFVLQSRDPHHYPVTQPGNLKGRSTHPPVKLVCGAVEAQEEAEAERETEEGKE